MYYIWTLDRYQMYKNKNTGEGINQHCKLFSCDMLEGSIRCTVRTCCSTSTVNIKYTVYYSIGIIIYVSHVILEGFDLHAT